MEQTIWLKIYSGLINYNSKYRFWSWMRQLLRRELQKLNKYGKRYLVSEKCVQLKLDKNQKSAHSNIDDWVSDEKLKSMISLLNDRERDVLIRYLYKGETQVSIAKDFGISSSRVNQIYLDVLDKIIGVIKK